MGQGPGVLIILNFLDGYYLLMQAPLLVLYYSRYILILIVAIVLIIIISLDCSVQVYCLILGNGY